MLTLLEPSFTAGLSQRHRKQLHPLHPTTKKSNRKIKHTEVNKCNHEISTHILQANPPKKLLETVREV